MSTTGRERHHGMTTASMEAYDGAGEQRAEIDGAGLVLLYAPSFAQMAACFVLAGRELTIGREPPAELIIAQPAVSRAHARVRREGEGWVITDLGGRNGTLVNGAFIRECRLFHNDLVRVGDCFLKFVAHDANWYQCYRIDGAVLSRQVPATPSGIVGGYQLARASQDLERIAKSGIAVVLLGESGTGKEVFARQVHAWSERPGAFGALNCAAIPPQLLESELFGYRRGAFSGADRDHVGLVRAANRGTLFLDEVGDLPLEAQAKLLRVLQTKEVLPLGATQPEQVDIRVVCATHRDLYGMQLEGSFRGDLYARLNEYSVTLPPLRERKEDIYALCIELLRLHKRPDLQLSVPYLTGLFDYEFPYNIRELEALIKRGIALVQGPSLEAIHLSEEIQARMKSYGKRGDPHAPVVSSKRPSQPPPPPGSLVPQSHGDARFQPPMSDPRYAQPPAESTPSGYASYGAAQGPVSPPAFAPLPPPRSPAPSWHDQAPLSQTAASAIPRAIQSYVPSEEELRSVLVAAKGNLAAVGRHYGKERMQIHRWLKRYNINPDEYRSG